LIGAFAVLVVVMLGSRFSPVLGYLFALSALVMIIVALHLESIWPTRTRRESAVAFSLFWGLMSGSLVPFLVTTFLDGGVSAIHELFKSQP
jgi:hypothetical protein